MCHTRLGLSADAQGGGCPQWYSLLSTYALPVPAVGQTPKVSQVPRLCKSHGVGHVEEDTKWGLKHR